MSINSFKTKSQLNGLSEYYYSIPKLADALEQNGIKEAKQLIKRLPFGIKVLLENILRNEDGRSVKAEDITSFIDWAKNRSSKKEIAYRPARVLLQDFTGVPVVADLAAMRSAVIEQKGDPQAINPLVPVDLVIDHSVIVDHFGSDNAYDKNMELEFERNKERYSFLRWGQTAFENLRVVPPGTGICHQVNVEYLSKVVWTKTQDDGETIAYPDTVVGADSHTTMVNGLAVLGWGVGGIEAEAAMLGQPVTMMIPEVIGVRLHGSMKEGVTATDLVLTITEILRSKGVVGKFVEFYGEGLKALSLTDRCTIANMAPEYGATCGLFPIDEATIEYLRFTGRDEKDVNLVEAYAKAQGMWGTKDDIIYTDTVSLNLSDIVPSLAGPKRPQDRVALTAMKDNIASVISQQKEKPSSAKVNGQDYDLQDGAVVIAAITSCTNTSNPSVLIAAGLVAKKARELGLSVKPWVKTSLAPGSQVVSDYLKKAGLEQYLDELGFHLVGYGCTTCIGNTGPLAEELVEVIEKDKIVTAAVLSGNRNFEGRVSPYTRANYLASPPLVVAYALAGTALTDLDKDSLGKDKDGNDVYLKDVWPSNEEISKVLLDCLTPEMFRERYAAVDKGPEPWQNLQIDGGETFSWNESSTYIQHPPFFAGMQPKPSATNNIEGARPLLILGDSVTTDHISPAGGFRKEHPAGVYLTERQVSPQAFNSYGSRRGNHEVMMRGTFANIRIRNEICQGTEGGFTKLLPEGELMSVYDAAMAYSKRGTPLVVFGGKEYGTGSSRDWAAKGSALLGVKAVITESFERIHRSNLVGMGILPLIFKNGENRKSLGISGDDIIDILGADDITPNKDMTLRITKADGSVKTTEVLCSIYTLDECSYYKNGGILQYVLRSMADDKAAA